MTAGRRAVRLAIRFYQLSLSGLVGRQCRHLPTCSDYMAEAVMRHGVWPGAWMGLARICRCGPGGTSGLDFVCEDLPPRSGWSRPWRYGRWRGTNEEPASAGASRREESQPEPTRTSTSALLPLSTRNSRV